MPAATLTPALLFNQPSKNLRGIQMKIAQVIIFITLFLLCGTRAPARIVESLVQSDGPQSTAAVSDCQPVKPSEIVNGIYLQVTGQPAAPQAASGLEAKLAAGQSSVKEIVRQLALSAEFKSRFVAARGVEEAVDLLHQRLLARRPRPEEIVKWAAVVRAQGIDFAVNSLIDGQEYGELFGANSVPGRPVRLRVCGLPGKLQQHDEVSRGQHLTTEVTISAKGRIESVTHVKNLGAADGFCGRVAFWLFDQQGNIVDIAGPPREQLWCVKGVNSGPAERSEEWHAEISEEILRKVAAVAIMHARGESDPRDMTRENVEKARQTKQRLK